MGTYGPLKEYMSDSEGKLGTKVAALAKDQEGVECQGLNPGGRSDEVSVRSPATEWSSGH